MAKTVLEQILENVRSGARLPLEGAPPESPGAAAAAERERSLLGVLDAAFDRLTAELAQQVAALPPGALPPDLHVRLPAMLARILHEEFGGDSCAPEMNAAGAPDERAILDEIAGRLQPGS